MFNRIIKSRRLKGDILVIMDQSEAYVIAAKHGNVQRLMELLDNEHVDLNYRSQTVFTSMLNNSSNE